MYYKANDQDCEFLEHYGMPRRSGRYPWGSGENPFQHEGDFLSRYNSYKKDGFTETEIAKLMGILNEKTGEPSTTLLRIQKSLATNERQAAKIRTVQAMTDRGMTPTEIGKAVGINESSVRSLLKQSVDKNALKAQEVADILMKTVDEKGMIDVGKGVEKEILNGISREKLKEALYICELKGYKLYGGGIPQVTNIGKQTNTKVLAPPGTEHKELYSDNWGNVHSFADYEEVGSDGKTQRQRDIPKYPQSISSDRVQIIFGDQGGADKDGVIELRPGTKDLSLGDSRYAQVRIAVDGTHYIKGMAIYSDNLPPGVDVRFNTNKKSGTPKEDVFKKLKDDKENPFGALIKRPSEGGQYNYIGEDGKEHLGAINKVKDEGDWDSYTDTLASQFLGKQSRSLIRTQLNKTYDQKYKEFNEIKDLTNPTIKRKMLDTFAEECDASAVHLKAAALPRQSWQVILPGTSMKDGEIYAPNYKQGETVALVRYPHGGTFEIPILKVNNKNPEARRIYGQMKDAVAINHNAAEQLSGADFDGDTVLVIPVNDKVRIASKKRLKGLEGFEPKLIYGSDKVTEDSDGTKHYFRNGKEFRQMNNTQTEMGKVSNLITDMTLKGASEDEITKAVKHSMVVIDAEKHHLDYKQSEIDNDIKSLKKKWQGNTDKGRYSEGASTLLSRAKSKYPVPERKGQRKIDPETGEKYFSESGRTYQKLDKNGNLITVKAMQDSTWGAEVKDAYELSSGTVQESIYADYANKMKALGNTARKEYLATGTLKYSPSAKKTYQQEVDSLMAKLNIALKNSPKEREAQRIANNRVGAQMQDNPDMSKSELKKKRQQALDYGRSVVGAGKEPIVITDREWEAIQAGAISDNVLSQILNNTDTNRVKELATPRPTTKVTASNANRIKALYASGRTASEIADALGISVSTVYANLD